VSQSAELARVKGRIKALTEKTVANGCTEAEAMAAAEITARCIQVEVPLGGRRRRPIDGCVPAIARFCDCKVWLARAGSGSRYVFFGFETDAALATYLFAVIDRVCCD